MQHPHSDVSGDDSPPAGESTIVRILAVPAMLAVGALVAVQTLINGALADRLGTGTRAGVAAAVVSFASGLVLLTAVVVLVPGPRRGLGRLVRAVGRGDLRPWQLGGGLVGAVLVASQGLAAATIGVALFTVAVVAGQTSSGLAVDRIGLGPAGARAVTPTRVIGAVLALVAVGLVAVGRLGGAHALTLGSLALALLPLAAGAGTSWQLAVNGRVSTVTGALPAAWNNSVVGMALLLALWLVSLARPGDLRTFPGPWWSVVGGVIGVVFIASAAALVRVHGVLVLGLCTIAGQVVTSLVLDAVTGVPLGAWAVGGALLTLAGVLVATWASRSTRQPGSTRTASDPLATCHREEAP